MNFTTLSIARDLRPSQGVCCGVCVSLCFISGQALGSTLEVGFLPFNILSISSLSPEPAGSIINNGCGAGLPVTHQTPAISAVLSLVLTKLKKIVRFLLVHRNQCPPIPRLHGHRKHPSHLARLRAVGAMATGGRANSSHCVGTFYLLLMLFGTMARTASISGPQDCSRS